MNVNGTARRSIWVDDADPTKICIIDQRQLPHRFEVEHLTTVEEATEAIKEMYVRGAPLIGVTAAYGMYLALLQIQKGEHGKDFLAKAIDMLKASRPTAINLAWAVDRVVNAIEANDNWSEKVKIAFELANEITEEDVQICKSIGEHGMELIRAISEKKNGAPVNILTHCNAGWLATVDYGTATSPMYHAHNAGIPIHVWVDETRPRNQGALTAWELGQHGIPHTFIVDNAGGHLMQHGMVDICFVGSDRTTFTGDVANKIGTYLKALAANDNGIPFYVALPFSTFDWTLRDGLNEIPIETRSEDEIHLIRGNHSNGIEQVKVTPEGSPVVNYGFDVTPRKYVSGLITERGICDANEESILKLYPEYKNTLV